MTFQKSLQKSKIFASFNWLGNSIDFLMKIARFSKDFMTDQEVNCFIVVDQSSGNLNCFTQADHCENTLPEGVEIYGMPLGQHLNLSNPFLD